LLNPLVKDEDAKLGEVPIDLKGDGSTRGRDIYPTEHRTLYRVVVTFDEVLHNQFDLRPPPVATSKSPTRGRVKIPHSTRL
jgi:hypothetical protein